MYFLLIELLPSCIGAIFCFLLLGFAFIHIQHCSNAAIVCHWNLPKDRNKYGAQQGIFFYPQKNTTNQIGFKAAFTALIDTCRDEIQTSCLERIKSVKQLNRLHSLRIKTLGFMLSSIFQFLKKTLEAVELLVCHYSRLFPYVRINNN